MNDTIFGDVTTTPMPMSSGGAANLEECANAIKNTVSGNSITVTDVSPLPHKCSCRLTDSSVSKNLYVLNKNNFSVNLESGRDTISHNFYVEGDKKGTIEYDGITFYGFSIDFYLRNLVVEGNYTFSLYSEGYPTLVRSIKAYDENNICISTTYGDSSDSMTFTHTGDISYYAVDYVIAHMDYADGTNWFNVSGVLKPQLELSNEATPWEPNNSVDFSTVTVIVSDGENSAEYIPSADGVVTDILSVSPEMTITTGNPDINIVDFTYCVDTKTYVDSNSGGEDVDLTDYVKNTDYPTRTTAGVVKVAGGDYGVEMRSDGIVQTVYASKNDIAKKTNYRGVIGPKLFDYAVKNSLTTNTETLTDEEKASACEWLGVDNFAVRNTVSGENFLTLTDVSALPHKCSCRLTSDTYESTLSDSRNILNLETANLSIGLNNYWGNTSEYLNITNNNDGSITVSGKIPPYDVLMVQAYICDMPKGNQYTASLRASNNDPISFQFLEFDAESMPVRGFDEEATTECTFTYGADNVEYYCINSYAIFNDTEADLDIGEITFYIQLEEKSQMTEWQPCGEGAVVNKPYIEDFSTVKLNVNGKTYTPTADGLVTDIASSPTMTITTNNEKVNIVDFTYCVDTKAYVDEGPAYEVITEITVEEAIRQITIPLGKERKSVKLYIKTPAVTTAGSATINFNGINAALLPSGSFSTSQEREMLVEIDVINGFGTLGKSSWSTNNLALGTTVQSFNDGVCTPISQFTLTKASLFEAGTTIKVWGKK